MGIAHHCDKYQIILKCRQPGFLAENFFRVRRAPKAQSPETNLAKKALEAISRHLDALF
jgi:hypothetical protein